MGMQEVITRTSVQAFVRSRMLSGFGPSDFSLGTRKFLFSVETEVYGGR